MKRTRKSWSYKIKMWFYRLTFRDIKCAVKVVSEFIFEFIMVFLGFVLIFLIPALFH